MNTKSRISKRLIIVAVLLLLLTALINNILVVSAQEDKPSNNDAVQQLEDNTQQNLDNLDLSKLDEWLAQVQNNQDSNIKEKIQQVLNGNYDNTFSTFFYEVGQVVKKSLLGILPLIISIICVALLYSILQNLTSGFAHSQIKDIAYYICYCAILVLVMSKVSSLIIQSVATISSIQKIMNGVFPVLLTFMTLLGGVNASATYKPMMSILANSITNIVVNIVVPIFLVVIIFGVVGSLSKNIKLNKISSFFKSLIKTILGGLFSIFATYITFQGFTSSVIDNISIKTAKFAVESYVPIVGGYLSDGFDLMLASIVLLKNSLGYVVVTTLVVSLIVPIVQILIFSLGLKLASGIIEPISDERFSKVLYDISKNITLLISIIVSVAVMFIITITLILWTFNLGVI